MDLNNDRLTPEAAAAIIAEERMDVRSVGPVACLSVAEHVDGSLWVADDGHGEWAAPTAAAFRAQVVEWREACR